MESIKDKLRKIKALADHGVAGEAKAAQYQLEKLLAKYNMCIEDIFDDTLKQRKFKVPKGQDQLFFQTLSSVIGNRFKECYYYKGKPSEQYIKLTDIEYIDIEQMFSFHSKQVKKELKKTVENLYTAYYYKHDLFNKDKQAVEVDSDDSSMSYEEYIEIMAMKDRLQDVTFRKQLNSAAV